jgi:H2C2 zinc finger
LGFKRIGRVPGCGHLKSFDEPVDAIIYGRDLKSDSNSVVDEERFDKIRYYLRHSLYPQGADRSEKSRLRSAATHYKLVGGENGVPEKLMLKGKEVVSDPQSQYEIAKQIHLQAHGGINKTTASIATKYHWVRIKETVSHVIKNCPECKDTNKPPLIRADNPRHLRHKTGDDFNPSINSQQPSPHESSQDTYNPTAQITSATDPQIADYDEMAIDPQIMEQIQAQLDSEYQQHPDPYVHSGLSDYGSTSQLQHHHGHGNDFVDEQSDHFMSDQNTAMLDHNPVLDASPQSQRLRQTRLSQQLLQANYISGNGSSGFSQ